MAIKHFAWLFFLFSGTAQASLNFEQALNKILKREVTVPTQESQVDASSALYWSKGASFLPTLTSGYTKSKTYTNISESNTKFFKGSVNLFKGGSDWANLQSSKNNLSLEEQKLKQVQLVAERNAVSKLVSSILNGRQVKIQKKLLALKKESLKITKHRYRKGLTPRQEVTKSEVDLGNGQARLIDAEILNENAAENLRALLGENKIKNIWPWKKTLNKLKKDDLYNRTLKTSKRPDFQKAKFEFNRDEQSLSASKRSLSPTLDFSMTWSKTDYGTSESSERTGLLTLSFPLFEGLSDYANIKSRRANLERSRNSFVQLKRDIESEWNELKRNLARKVQTANQRERNLNLSRRLYRKNLKRFRQGRVSVNDFQIDQNRLLDSETLANRGWSDVHLAWVDFCHAQGLELSRCE